MAVNVVLSLLQIVTLSFLGLGVFAWLPLSWRSRLLPLLPIAGLALAVVVLHVLTLVAPMAAAPWVLPVVAVVLIGTGVFVRRSARVVVGRRVVLGMAVATLPGVLVAPIGTFASAGAGLVQSSFNNDAFYYTAVARWLLAHPGVVAPQIGASPATGLDSPAFGPAASTINDSLRYGQELLSAWFSAVTGIDLVDTFTPWSATWVALIGLAAFAFVRLLPFRSGIAAVAAVGVSLSAAVLFQVSAQNADSLAGTGLALATSAVVLTVVRTEGGWRRWLPGALVAALLLGALVGTYSEYLAFIGPVLAVTVLGATRLALPGRVLRGGVIVVASAVLAAWPWLRAIRNILFISSIGGGEARQGAKALLYGALGPIGDVARVIDGRFAHVGLAAVAGLVLVVAAGAIVGLTSRRTRSLVVAVGLGATLVLGWSALRGNAYMVDRSADLITPFVVLVLAAATGLVIARAGRRRAFASAAVGLVAVGWTIGNVGLFAFTQFADWSARTVDEEYREVDSWVAEVADAEGGDVSVAVGDFFDQLWVSDSLAEYDDVAYLTLRGDLGYRGRLDLLSYWDGEIDRYLLVGPGVVWSAPDAAVVGRNDQFALIDTSVGDYAVAVPSSPTSLWAIYADADDHVSGAIGGSFVVITDRDRVVVTTGADQYGAYAAWELTVAVGWDLVDDGSGRLELTRPPGGLDTPPTITAVPGGFGTSFVLEGIGG